MSELLGLDHLALTEDGPTLSMGIAAGQWVSILGPAGSGKTWLMRILAGLERPSQGSVTRKAELFAALDSSTPQRLKPVTLARQNRGSSSASIATEALMATGLWDVKDQPLSQLSPSQVAAAELLRPLTSNCPILLFDGMLDNLDPWALRNVLDYLQKLRARGGCAVVVTNRPDLAKQFDTLIVLRSRTIRFAGTPEDLARLGPPHIFTVGADDQPGVKALVAPFSVRAESEGEYLRLEAEEGQELAARLLLEGYGNVRFVIQRSPSIEEALMAMMGG